MFNPHEVISTRTRQALGAVAILGVLAVWSALAGLDIVSQAKLPAPWEVASALGNLAMPNDKGESLLFAATWASLQRVVLAGVLVVVTGVPLGVLMGASPRINALLSPLVDPFRSAPIVAVLPILVMWLGIGELMKTTFLWAGAVVFLVPMVRDAIQAVPRTYYVKAKDLGASDFEAIWHSVFPMAKPRIADAMITAVSVEWTYITVAEYVNAKVGLGQLIQNARRFSAMDQVFAGIFVIIVLALITYQSMVAIKRWRYPWETE
ncbi:MAG: ABC transporter permease [Deltaproteobacteria bacterium]|nr:MAG: ABC transporter permease [Deltaproteobacteria bacterium]